MTRQSPKTLLALQLHAQGLNAHAAAKQAGITPAAMYRTLKIKRERKVCPHCGQVIRPKKADTDAPDAPPAF